MTETNNQPIPIYIAFIDNKYRYLKKPRYFHRTDTKLVTERVKTHRKHEIVNCINGRTKGKLENKKERT